MKLKLKLNLKAKKIPYYLLLLTLTVGASLIIGFLSFSGMFTLVPILALAFGAFALSVAYEGEIYLQNIKGALAKLYLKSDYLKHHLSNKYLLTKFSDKSIDTTAEDCPEYFKHYEAQLKLLAQFGHKRLDKKGRAQKKQIRKTLRDMEKWFALQLFSNSTEDATDLTEYQRELRQWLKENKQDEWQALLQKRNTMFNGVKAFSLLAGAFMGVGITYLLVEAFAVIPLMAAIPFGLLPIVIIPMALIAGVAYGLLTYNAVTDMINNDTLRTWYAKIRKYLKEGITFRNVFIAVSAVVLLTLTVALTVCTAGTWWTVAKHARPLFAWMGYMPSFIMGVINPLITGLSQLIFNLENTSESLEMIDEATKMKGNIFRKIGDHFVKTYNNLIANENWLQRINPARLLLKITFTPLRLLFFIGHLISIGLTADRVPGVPEILSALLGIFSEFFEDTHYFIGDLLHNHHEHDHPHSTKKLLKERFGSGHGHDHSADIPTRLLKLVFYPLFVLAAGWDTWASNSNTAPRKVLNFRQAMNKHTGQPDEESVDLVLDSQPSDAWRIEQAVFRIDNHIEHHLQKAVLKKEVSEVKVKHLKALRQELLEIDVDEDKHTAKELIEKAVMNPVYNTQRFFNYEDKTSTAEFLENLSERAAPAA